MRQVFSIFLVSLLVFSSLCINRAPTTKTSIQSSSKASTQEIVTFLSEAKKSIEECNTTLKKPLASWSKLEYLNMSVLNETIIELEGKKYRYIILGIWNVSFSGEVNINGYKIVWEQPKNLTTTGGQRVDFKIYKDGTTVGSFTYWYTPFQLNSYCLVIDSRSVNLADNSTLSFIFMHTEGKDLWLVLLK